MTMACVAPAQRRLPATREGGVSDVQDIVASALPIVLMVVAGIIVWAIRCWFEWREHFLVVVTFVIVCAVGLVATDAGP